MLGYASAWFGDDSPLRSDALTVSGYLGPESLRETLNYAQDVQGGLFILAATSNPEAAQLQQALIGGRTVAANVIDSARDIGQGEMGVVIGATQNFAEFGIQQLTQQDIGIPILAPGFGAQGARLEDLKDTFGASSHRVIAAMSREFTKHGPEQVGNLIDKTKAKL
jgi:orotidine-5'-phosphate decarboxylase